MTIELDRQTKSFVKNLTNDLVSLSNQFVKFLINNCLVRQTNYHLNKETTIKRL